MLHNSPAMLRIMRSRCRMPRPPFAGDLHRTRPCQARRGLPLHAVFPLADVRHEMLMADAPRDGRIALRVGAKRLRIRIGVQALMPSAGERTRIERGGIAA